MRCAVQLVIGREVRDLADDVGRDERHERRERVEREHPDQLRAVLADEHLGVGANGGGIGDWQLHQASSRNTIWR